jgi:hypothetical protein
VSGKGQIDGDGFPRQGDVVTDPQASNTERLTKSCFRLVEAPARSKSTFFLTEKLHLILHLNLHLASNSEAIRGQCVALKERTKNRLTPL